MISKIANLIKCYQYQVFLTACMLLIAFTGYNLGRINANEKRPIKIENGANIYSAIKSSEIADQGQGTTSLRTPTKKLDTRVVASKNSDKYHYTWCSGANRIKEENKVWFASDKEAESRGYTLAGNCTK